MYTGSSCRVEQKPKNEGENDEDIIYIRADANKVIATGHIMRCCAIADALKQQNRKAVFIVADGDGEEIVREQGYNCIKLDSRWDDLESEIDILADLIRKDSIKKLLIDSYYVTEKYLLSLRKKTQVTYIDDLHDMVYPCHNLINYAIYAAEFPYGQEYTQTRVFLGCEYVPLRQVFDGIAAKYIKKQIENILVITGGSDSFHFVHRFINLVMVDERFSSIKFNIVCGRYSKDYQELLELTRSRKNIRLHKNIEDMESYMEHADLAVSAGGTALYELCACGTPTICFALADNQLRNVDVFQKKGIMLNCGDIRYNNNFFDLMEKQIDHLMKYPEIRSKLSANMQQLVDGKGGGRIAQFLMEDRS